MLMVVFGAGASADSVNQQICRISGQDTTRFKPPMASELFDDRDSFGTYVESYYQCGTLIYDLRRLAEGTTIEDELQRIEQDAKRFARRHIQLAALRFYLRSVVGLCADRWSALSNHLTNYRQLIDRIESWRHSTGTPVIYVTFNYDTLLEDACSREMDVQFASMGSYVERPDFKLFKVHGSVTWGRVVNPTNKLIGLRTHTDIAHAMIREYDRLPIQDEFVVLRGLEQVFTQEGRQTRYEFPAIAIPVRDKTRRGFEMPDSHEQALISLLGRVSTLLIIGWAAADTHLLRLFQEQGVQPRRTLVVSGSPEDARAPIARLAEWGLNQNVHAARGGFSGLMTKHVSELAAVLPE